MGYLSSIISGSHILIHPAYQEGILFKMIILKNDENWSGKYKHNL